MQLIEKKLSKLEEQKQKLEKEILALQNKRHEEFISLLNKIPNLNLDHLTLIGGLLNLLELANRKPELKEEWLKAAEKFCGRLPSQKRTKTPQPTSQKSA